MKERAKKPRQDAILEMVALDGEVSVDELAGRFGVSVMTIRRDLAELERTGRLSRVHGGAVASRAAVVEFAYRQKSHVRLDRKRAIAWRACELVSPGMAVSLDTGSTTLEVARCLAEHRQITVLTTSLSIASALYGSREMEIVLLGGTMSRTRPELAGPLTEDNLRKFRVHVAFLGADAVTPEGMFTTEVQTARICQAMIEHAQKVVLVVDSSKFHATSFVRYGALGDVHTVITDNQCRGDVRHWLDSAVDEVVYTEAPGVPKRNKAGKG